MRFCPKCDVRLRAGEGSLVCPKCGHAEGGAPEGTKRPEPAAAQGFKVLDESEARGPESTIEKECEKCGNGEAVWWMLQTRSADEPTTQFYRCTKCSHTWRDYS